MKKLLIIVALTAFSFLGQAQDAGIRGFKIGGGLDLLIPASKLSGSSIGAGIDLLGQYGISDNVAITADAGYSVLFGKDNFGDLSIIPIRAGLRFYPAPEFYVGGKVGVGILKTKGVDSRSATAYSFGAGYVMSPKVDIGASYDGYSKTGSFGLVNVRLGYTFSN